MNIDERYMRIAINLAKKAQGLTHPNPIVGAVVVKNNRIVAKGYHKACGLPHAEVNALKAAGREAKGAALYVTLEPCDHFGRTPPCTNAIIRSGIKEVVMAMKDPNPINNGRGVLKLKRHGLNVACGMLEGEAMAMNKPYIKFITKRLPYITIKVAQSIDGKIATSTGDSRWISSEESRRYVHMLRGKADAVMVGVNTVIKDDPLLLSKTSKGKQPVRVVVDSRLRTPIDAKIFSNLNRSQVIIATTKFASVIKARQYEARGAKVLRLASEEKRVGLKNLFKTLGKMGMIDVLVEGGGELAASLVESGLVDRFLFFIAPRIIGGRNAVTSVEGRGVKNISNSVVLKNIKIKRFADDILIDAEAA